MAAQSSSARIFETVERLLECDSEIRLWVTTHFVRPERYNKKLTGRQKVGRALCRDR